MSANPPPVPPEQRSDKGTAPQHGEANPLSAGRPPVPQNLAEQARQGNTKQNTTNKGFQQDR